MALNDDGQNVMLGGSSVPVTVQVLDAHPDCESLQEAGLSLIQNVTFECQEGCEVALRHNAVRAATRALGLFRGTADIQEARYSPTSPAWVGCLRGSRIDVMKALVLFIVIISTFI